ncbi:MAG: phage tail tape measure protein [FCB group bacterium]|nr:phage tail tape measure protein [FCB group bacterium]MBL7027419.1 phage tail tape measure protein [Candidatus Neomarinimicrobiota bacterium]MBL7122599.1 phage tail tape measure protein [Candidatus Neomarinimicrobiota bacterium]
MIESLGGVDDAEKKVTGFTGKAQVGFTSLIGKMSAASFGINQISMVAQKGMDLLSAPLDKFSEYESRLYNVKSLGVENIEALGESVLGLTDSIPKSANELSESLYDVVSAGVDSANQISYLELNAKAATAGLAETSDAIALSSAIVKGYGKDWSESETILDQAFKTVELGQTTFPELAGSIQSVTPAFAAMDFKTQELFGSFATLTGVTGNASEVSTQLKAVMTGLAAPTKDLTALARKHGFATVEQMAKTKGLTGVLKLVKDETGGSAAKMGKLFGSVEAVTGLLALTGSQYDTFIDKTGQMSESTGAMSDAFDINAASAENSEQMIKNKFDKALIGLGEHLMPVKLAIMDFGVQIMDGIDWEPILLGIDDTITFLGDLWDQTEPLIVSLWDLGVAFEKAIPWEAVSAGFDMVVGWIDKAVSGYKMLFELMGLLDDENADAPENSKIADAHDGETKAVNRKAAAIERTTRATRELKRERSTGRKPESGDTDPQVEPTGQTPSVELERVSLEDRLELNQLYFENAQILEDDYYQNKFSLMDQLAATYDLNNADEKKQHLKLTADKLKAEKKYQANKAKVEKGAYTSTLSLYSQMMSAFQGKSETMFKVGKAASLVQAGINTYEGATAAYKSMAGIPVVGPGLGVLAAGAAVALGLANVAEIRSQKFEKMKAGGFLGDGMRTLANGDYGDGEDLMIIANSDEYIVNAEATRKHRGLLEYINHYNPPKMAAGGLVGGGSAAPSLGINAEDLELAMRRALSDSTIKISGETRMDNGDIYLSWESGKLEIEAGRV